MQLNSINKGKTPPPGSPPGTKEFIDKNIVYLETFAKRLSDLVLELSTTMDTTPVPITKIDELITKYTAPPGTTMTTMTPDIGLIIAIRFDLGGVKQLASEVPKTIFDKYINYRIDLMNGLFSSNNIDEILNLASTMPSVVIDKVQMKSKIIQYLDDFKQLQTNPPPPTTRISYYRSPSYATSSLTTPTLSFMPPSYTRPGVARKQRLEDIPILPQTNDNSSSWFKL
jgi:hypothetical protein